MKLLYLYQGGLEPDNFVRLDENTARHRRLVINALYFRLLNCLNRHQHPYCVIVLGRVKMAAVTFKDLSHGACPKESKLSEVFKQELGRSLVPIEVIQQVL